MLIQNPTAKEVKFAKALVNPDKAVRDKTLQSLQAVLSNNKTISNTSLFGDKEALKLWKALYYSLWLADKASVQQELCESLVDMLDGMTHSAQLSYLHAALRTILREWTLLDQYRINKFYSLLRLLLRKVFTIFQHQRFTGDHVSAVLEVLETEVLLRQPNGPRYHLVDIYLPELYGVSPELTSGQFLTILGPFLRSLSRHDDAAYRNRVNKMIFTAYADKYAVENVDSEVVFRRVITETLQKTVFAIAADEATPDHLRNGIYALHKQLGSKTGKPFIEEATVVMEEKSKRGKKKHVRAEMSQAVPASAAVPVIAAAELAHDGEADIKDKKKRKKEKTDVGEPYQEGTAKELAMKSKKVKKAHHSKV
jgi:ribosomal RNA-processing protein 1